MRHGVETTLMNIVFNPLIEILEKSKKYRGALVEA